MKNKLIAAIILSILAYLTYVIINVEEIKIKTTEYDLNCNKFRICKLNLIGMISTRGDYLELQKTLNNLDSFYVLNIYIAGPGGYIEGLDFLYNTFDEFKGKIVTHVVGEVDSASALLGLIGDEIVIGDNTLYMFHHSSVYGQQEKYCFSSLGKTDRTQDLYKKCIDKINTHLEVFSRYFTVRYKHLFTEQELNDILTGHDVYIPGYVIKERLNKYANIRTKVR